MDTLDLLWRTCPVTLLSTMHTTVSLGWNQTAVVLPVSGVGFRRALASISLLDRGWLPTALCGVIWPIEIREWPSFETEEAALMTSELPLEFSCLEEWRKLEAE